jgi:glycosyltransferase involved in cell wall biosynthesis
MNDGSTDGTGSKLAEIKGDSYIVLTHKKNQGKGATLKTGFDYVRTHDFDAVICMDGDEQHDPSHIEEFIRDLRDNSIVFGYRTLGRDVPLYRRFGNAFARQIFQRIFGIRRKDLLCGYMGFRREIFQDLTWQSDDYGVEVELSTIIGKKRLPIKEIQVATIYHDRFKGVSMFDAFRIFLKIPWWYLKY